MCLPGCLFVCHLILLLVCFLFNPHISPVAFQHVTAVNPQSYKINQLS